MRCTHCGSNDYVKNGSYKGSQRYKCKICKRAFSDKVRKFTYADKERCLEMYLDNSGIRNCARRMHCSPSLIVRWIREFANNLRDNLKNAEVNFPDDHLPDIIEMDEIYTRVKKGLQESKFGLLILGKEVKLLRIQ